MPINTPTGGWQALYTGKSKKVTLPANVEEHYWGKNGNTFGISSNYKGVSWFYTNVVIPTNMKGQRMVLKFESTRLRAEIFLNEQLVGYDLMNATTYEVDITDVAKLGVTNKLAVRITDADGNFEWMDLAPHNWGKYKIPPSHGFGGITGKVFLQSTPKQFIQDVFIKNKPQVNSIDAEILLANSRKNNVVEVQLLDANKIIETKKILVNQALLTTSFTLVNAKLWNVDTPYLYKLKISYTTTNKTKHTIIKKFGFRWFEVKDNSGDKQFFLNGKRIVIRTSISWGFWPINGISPTRELAKKQIVIAKKMGLNCLNFHRHMGQDFILDLADEMGLLYYAEPGGYKTGIASDFTANWNRIRMERMIKLFRSHPSLIIYNMINESTRDPLAHEINDIKLFHQLDPTRCITFTSTNFTKALYNGVLEEGVEKLAKMHMLPYDSNVYYKGWWDIHNADGPGVYKDEFYKSANNLLRGSNNKSEIVFWGEEGAIGTPPRLELAINAFSAAKKLGWDGDYYINQFIAFDKYLTEKGYRKAFPTVDSLCKSLGNNALYYQGRIIENIRINNTTDGYVVNGWESTKIENHSGVVDVWRNPKGNPNIMAYYNQPLFVAVKAQQKVLKRGDKSVVDFFIVNEKNITGLAQLVIKVQDNQGIIFNNSFNVSITGNTTYGEILKKGIEIITQQEGYTTITATLIQNNKIIASGKEELYVVDLPIGSIKQQVYVSDTSGNIQKMLKATNIPFINIEGEFKNDLQGTLLFDGSNLKFLKNTWRNHNEFIEWVGNGNTGICLTNADVFADFLEKKEVINYYGKQDIGSVWYGGNYFNRSHPLFNGLPVNTAFNWEYQSLADYDKKRIGLRLRGEYSIAGIYADHRQEVYTALGIVPYGRGEIILSTFDLVKAITKEKSQANIVAKRLLLNYILLSEKNN